LGTLWITENKGRNPDRGGTGYGTGEDFTDNFINSDDSYLQLSCKAPAELFQNMWRACYEAESVVQKWQGASKRLCFKKIFWSASKSRALGWSEKFCFVMHPPNTVGVGNFAL
jgi:hypothetical protein